VGGGGKAKREFNPHTIITLYQPMVSGSTFQNIIDNRLRSPLGHPFRLHLKLIPIVTDVPYLLNLTYLLPF